MLKYVTSCLLCLASVSTASATVYTYEAVNGVGPGNPSFSNAAGNLDHFLASFDDATGMLSLSWTVSAHNGALANGFSLVLTDGDNPKDIAMGNPNAEFAMLYFDATGANPAMTAYKYDGTPFYSSYESPNPMAIGLGDQSDIASINAATNGNGSRTFGFSLDTSVLGNYSASFGSEIGIWFHLFNGAEFLYADSGRIADFDFKGGQGFFDGSNLQTTEVPEPSTMLLLASGAVGLRLRRRRAA